MWGAARRHDPTHQQRPGHYLRPLHCNQDLGEPMARIDYIRWPSGKLIGFAIMVKPPDPPQHPRISMIGWPGCPRHPRSNLEIIGALMPWPIGTDDRQNPQEWERDIFPLDPEIAPAVRVLVNAGVETFESCSGCDGHAFPEPTVRFHGGQGEGMRVLGIALQHGLKVSALRRYWSIQDGEPHGPHWEITL